MEEEFTEAGGGGGGGSDAGAAPEPDSTEDKEYSGGDDYEDGGEGEDGGYRRNNRMQFRGRGRGPPPGWMNGPPPGCPPPMRFRGRGYGPSGPPMRGGRGGFFRGRGGPGGPRFNGPPNGPNFDGNWGPMGPPPPMMGGPPPPYGPPPMMGPGGPMGPPPSLMGQPPFGGPPGMPPPNMVPELWVETKSDDGKSYYYHSRTRETTWTRPQDSPACKVITQAEMEAMAATGQMQGINPQAMGMNGPMGGPPMGMPGMMGANGMIGMMPPNMGAPPGSGQGPPPLSFMGAGPPPWIIKDNDNNNGYDSTYPPFMPPSMGNAAPGKDSPNNQSSQDSNSGGEGGDDAPPGESPVTPVPTGPPPGFPNPALGGPPPGFAGGWGAGAPWGGAPPSWPPPLLPPVNQPPPTVSSTTGPPGAPTSLPSLLGAAGALTAVAETAPAAEPTPASLNSQQPPPEKDEPPAAIPAELTARAAEWTTHRAPDGRPYYYCAKRQESVWEKPQPLKELDELNDKISGKSKKDETMDVDKPRPTMLMEVIDVEAHEEARLERAAAERAAMEERERAERERIEREKAEKERLEKERVEKEKAAAAAKAADKSRPITSTPISGTPWCVVWTGDGRVFFYNPTAHSSVWERPKELIGRADVDKAVSSPPEALLERQKKEALASGKAVAIGGGAATGAAVASANGDLKRAAEESDSDESEPEPAKKAKQDDGKKIGGGGGAAAGVTVIDAGKEAAIEAEVRAARERAVVPLELRIKSFRQMLQEKEVSAFSTWEKELHKIVFDSRYLLLTSKERKQVFDKYVRERAEEERKEKRNRLKMKKDAFRALMEEAKLHAKSSFTEFAAKFAKEERLRGIEKTRERESLFNEYIVELRKKEKEEKVAKREQVKKDLLALLREKEVDRHARWADAKKKLDGDARYKAVESSAAREDIFREYCKLAKDEKKKDKGSERESRGGRKDKKEKERDKEKEKEKKKEKEKEKGKEKGSDQEGASEAEAEGAGGGGGGAEGGEEAAAAAAEEEARERAARAEASIKEREKEVQRALATSLRDRDKEREYHKRDEAVQHFNALLADLVRNADLTWRDARKQLKKDHRYALAELLSKEDKERLFTAHTSALAAKRRDKFRELLDDLGVSMTAYWRDVRKKAKDDPRASKFASPDKCEREFRDYQRDRLAAAKVSLRALLQETRTLTHRSLASVRGNKTNLAALQESLAHDARYLVLNHIPDERDEIIMGYLEELEKKGPPPPPTATEPSRRPNK